MLPHSAVAELVAIALLFIFGWHFILASRGMYDSRRIGSTTRDLCTVVVAAALGTAFLVVLLVLFESPLATRLFAINMFAALWFLLSLSRLAMRVGLHRLRSHGRNLRFVLIVGTGPRARRLVEAIESAPHLGYRIVGFVDDDNLLPEGAALMGRIADLPRLLSSNIVDEIFVALPIRSRYAATQNVALEAEKQGVPVMLLPDLFTMQLARARFGLVGDSPVVRFITGPEVDGRMVAKRAFDVLAASAALLALAPLLVATALRPHGLSFLSPGVVLASIDHAMWFHRPARADEWLLYSMDSPSASGARGLARASIFTREGVLVASTAQEGLLRAGPSRGSGSRAGPAPA
jgi:hypothetical protein